ncbi:MAG: hypothetical protein Q7S33_01300 [Nanoarchaeota archaeon]|nr:hypothetical protein [Nanoarchaeota archaeon]
MEKSDKKKFFYFRSDKIKWEDIQKAIPHAIIPDAKKISEIFGVVLLAMIVGNIFISLFGMLSSGFSISSSKPIAIGYPFTFFELNLVNVAAFPFKFSGFFLDILIYLLISYLVLVVWNVMAELIKIDKDRSQPARLYKIPLSQNPPKPNISPVNYQRK